VRIKSVKKDNTMSREKHKRLRLAGLIVGIAGLIEVIVWGLFNSEGGPGWWAIPPLIVYGIPFILGLLLCWKWPLVGSISLIIIALFWLVLLTALVFSSGTSQSIVELLPTISGILAISLPQFITGILFLLSWRAERIV